MATLDYIDVPPGATRLRMPSESDAKNDASHEIRPAPKIITSIPQPSPPPSPTTAKRRSSILSSTANSLSSPTMSVIPQLLLSATLPSMTSTSTTSNPSTSNPQKKLDPDNPTLLSSKDPLSLPIMTTNFRRFVSIIGPVFWLQDRMEEILLWKRGWMRTAVWVAAYAFLCFYPRLLLLIPHMVLISVILATYPYPSKSSTNPLYTSETSNEPLLTDSPPAEGSVPWQANIQGIQNLMGAVSDLHDIFEPYIYHLCLTPAHLSTTRQRSNPTSSAQPPPTARSPYTTHILTLLALSFFPLLFIIHLPTFPIRETCLFIGLAPFFVTHPYIRALMPVLLHALVKLAPVMLVRLLEMKHRVAVALRLRMDDVRAGPVKLMGAEPVGEREPPLPLSMVLRRMMDDDRLSDECWNSEMREVQLWENERFGGPLPGDSPTMAATMTTSSSTSSVPPQKGWSKQNLRPGERTAWTRGRDGWSGVGSGGSGSLVEGAGEVSNLTFSLAPGWAFVESEDWRKDLQCVWSGCGGDSDGWVYTNDAWLGPRPSPYTSGGGSLTRRRRWVRRVWYDPKRESEDS